MDHKAKKKKNTCVSGNPTDPNLFLQAGELSVISAIFGSAHSLWREISRYLQAIKAVQFRYTVIPQEVHFM